MRFPRFVPLYVVLTLNHEGDVGFDEGFEAVVVQHLD
jgi:hypothetical protein